jgi:hypothetical protein
MSDMPSDDGSLRGTRFSIAPNRGRAIALPQFLVTPDPSQDGLKPV